MRQEGRCAGRPADALVEHADGSGIHAAGYAGQRAVRRDHDAHGTGRYDGYRALIRATPLEAVSAS